MKKSEFSPEALQVFLRDIESEFGKTIANICKGFIDTMPPDGDIQLSEMLDKIAKYHYKEHGCNVIGHGHMPFNS